MDWVTETFRDFYKMSYRIEKKLFEGQSDFQKVEVVQTTDYGKMLLNDGLVMVTERDEFVYHDMISHVPLFIHPNPQNVLIIGGGDGGTAREVIRHSQVEKCTMVEIDKMVVDASIEHIPQTSKDLNHEKVSLIIDDGVKFVKETKEKFDIILVDSTDPIGPAQPLFGAEFYKDIFNCLSDDGIVVSQGESPFYETVMQDKLMGIISDIFPITSIYNFHNLTYPGGFWSFSYASKKYHPLKDLKQERIISENLKFDYYNEETHIAAFALPEFMKKRVSKFIKGM